MQGNWQRWKFYRVFFGAAVTKQTVIPAKSSVASSALPLKPQVTTTIAVFVTQPLPLLSHATFERQERLPALSKPKLGAGRRGPATAGRGSYGGAAPCAATKTPPAFSPKCTTVRPFF